MADGAVTSHALTQAYLDRIAAIDKAGPALNSVIELNPDALNDADALDAERKAGKLRGPLHGIPVLLKDNIDATADGDHRRLAGAGRTTGRRRDAFLVRAAARGRRGDPRQDQPVSEWANFRSTRSTTGWSGRGGQTRNPYVLDRNPCGSSSGTGAAIAANLAAVGVGTETDGSIICPSAMTGLVGLKPTVGLVSRSGIIPISRLAGHRRADDAQRRRRRRAADRDRRRPMPTMRPAASGRKAQRPTTPRSSRPTR